MKFYDKLLGHDDSSLYNSRGHRCKDLEEINLHNYLLFAGDNVSLGLDKPIEETYPYLISKELKMDYYNISLFNGGIDSIKYNLLVWNKIISTKPKAIIVSTEFLNSFLVSDKNYTELKVADFSNEAVADVLSAGNTTQFFPARHLLADKLLQNMINIPIYQIEFVNKIPLFSNNIFNTLYENDIVNHIEIAELVINKFKKNAMKVLP